MTDNEFYESMKSEYAYLNQKVFDLCYGYAWQLGHAYGHSEVEGRLVDIVEFAEDIIGASKC